MKRSERGSLIAVFAAIVTVALVGVLGFIFWQNYMQPKTDDAVDQDQSIQETPRQTVTSTLEEWTISFQAPESWKVETSDSQVYNYEMSAFEKGNQTKLIHPSGKVSVMVQHNPTSVVDGTCGPSSIVYVNKEALADNRLALLEAIGEGERGPYFLGLTDAERAADINEDSDSCSLHPGLGEISQEGRGLTAVGQPYVSVAIVPSFVDYGDSAAVWDDQALLNFLKTDEYLEAKAVVRSLQL